MESKQFMIPILYRDTVSRELACSDALTSILLVSHRICPGCSWWCRFLPSDNSSSNPYVETSNAH